MNNININMINIKNIKELGLNGLVTKKNRRFGYKNN